MWCNAAVTMVLAWNTSWEFDPTLGWVGVLNSVHNGVSVDSQA
ncbi:hypothetical protein [Corynebacterium parakroppenstedtii]|nr:hypothetical protein [Corynebacterium parakroppenstedtii]